ncbi:unnamed protein product [Cunninghamella blakesleeana]
MKKETIQCTVFVLFSIILGYIARQAINSVLQEVGPHLVETCQSSPIVFTNNVQLDGFLCVLKVFFRRAMDDHMGKQITRIILGLFGTVQVIMATEGSRYGYNKWYNIVSWFMFWGMAANVFTIAVISTLCWVPLLVITSFSFITKTRQGKSDPQNDRSIPVMCSLQRVSAIFFSVLFTYGLLSLFMTTSILTEPSTWLSDQIIVLWQFAPILFHLLYILLTLLFSHIPFFYNYFNDSRVQPVLLSQIDHNNNDSQYDDDNVNSVNQVRQRVRMVQSKSAIEKNYILLAGINLFIYYGCYFESQTEGLYIKDSLIMLFFKAIPAMGLNEIQITQFLCSHFLLVDLLVTTLIYTVWAFYEDGFVAFLFVLLGNLVFGPGASIAIYAAYREYRIQDPENLKLRVKKEN